MVFAITQPDFWDGNPMVYFHYFYIFYRKYFMVYNTIYYHSIFFHFVKKKVMTLCLRRWNTFFRDQIFVYYGNKMSRYDIFKKCHRNKNTIFYFELSYRGYYHYFFISQYFHLEIEITIYYHFGYPEMLKVDGNAS